MRRSIYDAGIPAANRERTDRFRAGVERHACPAINALGIRFDAACLAFPGVIGCQNTPPGANDFRAEAGIRWHGQVFARADPVVFFYTKCKIKIIVGFIIQRDVEIIHRQRLVGLGVDQLHDIVEGDGHVDALGHTRQDVHLAHPSFQLVDHLGAFHGHCCCNADLLQEAQVARTIHLPGAARPQRQPADRMFAAR